MSRRTEGDDDGFLREMCPEKERLMRTYHELIHPLEKSSLPDGEPRLVKKFSRSAAGQKLDDPDELRSPYICRRSARYLVKTILGQTFDKSRYHFVLDRLRAIRQDLVIQGTKSEATKEVLEISVRFHLYASCRLSHLSAEDFDSHSNFKHLLECLKSVLILYDEIDVPPHQRLEMAVAYLILNLGSASAIAWGLGLRKEIRKSWAIEQALQINFCYLQRNYVRLFKLLKELPVISKLAFHWNRSTVMHDIFQVMNVAFSSKTLVYPVSEICRLFDVKNAEQVIQMCERLGISTKDDNVICFSKGQFFPKEKLNPFHESQSDRDLLGKNLSQFLLEGSAAPSRKSSLGILTIQS